MLIDGNKLIRTRRIFLLLEQHTQNITHCKQI